MNNHQAGKTYSESQTVCAVEKDLTPLKTAKLLSAYIVLTARKK
ncbi:MAG: hypothetical protein RMX68_010065 [Aulosira sp. ZfuVER01]|nr:hypothetical protein [Aulosira sp. ZfuVER01]MDZ7998063.1 hypothetical protein [Aulosira sp. DedVER01a]MDZ8050457.1 hypothetical protein [Aulosira sp. ZfuCHP01]